jgi:hypothetical protein
MADTVGKQVQHSPTRHARCASKKCPLHSIGAHTAGRDRSLARNLVQRMSGEVVGEVPGPEIAWFEAYEKVVLGPLGICGSGLWTEVATGDSDRRVLDSRGDEACVATQFDTSVRRRVLADDDARSRISPQMHRLPVAAPRDDVETALSPLMPDGGEKYASIAPIRGKNGQQRELDEISQVLDGEALAHPSQATPCADRPFCSSLIGQDGRGYGRSG